MATHELKVTANGDFVGTLGFDSETGQFSFTYDPTWLKFDGFLLSPRLTPEVCASARASTELRMFLGNLLPEGQALDDVAAATRISKNNVFGLVKLLGRETAGALTLLEPKETPDLEPVRRLLSYPELSDRINRRDEIPFSLWDGKVRLSIAGYQDKIAVFKEGQELFLADGSLASTHILKPPPRNRKVAKLVINEHFCMELARRVNLPVAPVELIRVPEPVLLIERFDREVLSKDRVHRLHMIDGCQALGLPPDYKYERNFGNGKDVRQIREGASLPRIFGLIGLVHSKAAGKLALLRWTLFQYLIGNSDAHGKNVSFFVQGKALLQTPAYDLVCVEAHPEFEHVGAMAIGDTFEFDAVAAFDWAQFAVSVGLPRPLVGSEMRKLADAVLVNIEPEPKALYEKDDLEYLEGVTALIRRRAQKMLVDSKEAPKVDKALLE